MFAANEVGIELHAMQVHITPSNSLDVVALIDEKGVTRAVPYGVTVESILNAIGASADLEDVADGDVVQFLDPVTVDMYVDQDEDGERSSLPGAPPFILTIMPADGDDGEDLLVLGYTVGEELAGTMDGAVRLVESFIDNELDELRSVVGPDGREYQVRVSVSLVLAE